MRTRQWMVVLLILTLSFTAIGQEDTPFGKYVFQGINLGYNAETKELITPDWNDGLPRQDCRRKFKPDRFTCHTKDQELVHIYLEESSPSNFETTVFHPGKRTETKFTSISSIVRDGKVDRQSQCLFDSVNIFERNSDKSHRRVTDFNCHVITAKLCEPISRIKEQADFKDEAIFQDFLKVLTSDEYKKEVREAYAYNYGNTFLHANHESGKYDHYSKIPKSQYRDKVEGKDERLKVRYFGDSDAIKGDAALGQEPAKTFEEVFDRETKLIEDYYYNSCKSLLYFDILAQPGEE